MLKEQSAGEFLRLLAEQIQLWLDERDEGGASTGKLLVLSVTLASGQSVMAHRLSAHGHSMIKLEGVTSDGKPCILLAHHHSIHLLAYHAPRKPEDKESKREIGFHTGLKEIKINQ